jgi:hypothetical protein
MRTINHALLGMAKLSSSKFLNFLKGWSMIKKLKWVILLPQTIFALVITDASVGIVDVDKSTNCLYAMFQNNTLRKTCNNGASWTTLQVPPNISSASNMKIDSLNHQVYVYGGVGIYRSSIASNSLNWQYITLPANSSANYYKPMDIANGKLYFQSGNKLYSKTISGNWVATGAFPSASNIESWEVLDNGAMYLGDYNFKVYKSSNGGQSWSETNWMTATHQMADTVTSEEIDACNSDPAMCVDVGMMQSSPASLESINNTLFSGSYVAGVHVYKSSSWSQISRTPYPSSLGAFTIALVNSQTIYTQPSNYGFGDIPVHPVYRTVNQGQSWEKVDAGMYFKVPLYADPQNIKVYAVNNGTVYAMVNDGSLYSIKYPNKTWRCLVNNAKPVVATNKAENLNEKINLKASVYPNGLQNTVWFEYGESKSLGNTTVPSNVNSTYGAKNIMHSVNNFESNSGKIYYRVVSSNSKGISRGKILEHDTFDIASVLSAILSVMDD